MNDVQIVLKCRKLAKNPPKTYSGKCPVCGSESISQPLEGPLFEYYIKDGTAEIYLNCEKCGAEFTLSYSFKEVLIERVVKIESYFKQIKTSGDIIWE